MSLIRPSMMTASAPMRFARVDISPPQHAEYKPFGCWMYMILPGSLQSAKCFGGDGAFRSDISTIFTVTTWPNTGVVGVVVSGEYILIPSKKPPKGYLSLTSASPIYRISRETLKASAELTSHVVKARKRCRFPAAILIRSIEWACRKIFVSIRETRASVEVM